MLGKPERYKVTDDAKASGVDVSDNWVLSGGIRSWEEATRRLGELEAGLECTVRVAFCIVETQG